MSEEAGCSHHDLLHHTAPASCMGIRTSKKFGIWSAWFTYLQVYKEFLCSPSILLGLQVYRFTMNYDVLHIICLVYRFTDLQLNLSVSHGFDFKCDWFTGLQVYNEF